jgi:hypothetical protein
MFKKGYTMWSRFLVFLCFVTLLSATPTTRGVKYVEGDRQTYQRLALVIGNNDYQEFKLSNAVEDARAMKAFLESKKFKVIYAENADIKTMKAKRDEFIYGLQNKSIAFVYYSGHGIQGKSYKSGEVTNFLLATDNANLGTLYRLEEQSLSLNQMLLELNEKNHGSNIVLIDSCRSSYERTFSRSGGYNTLSNISGKGTYLVYSTSSGATASDNGQFRKSFIKYANQPLSLNDVFENVKVDLDYMSQLPSIHNNALHIGNLYLTENKYQKQPVSSTVVPTDLPPIQKEGITIVNGLEYQNQPFKDELTWHDAKDYCKALELHGKGWRLPNVYELRQLLLEYQVANSSERSHYIRRDFVENMPKNSWFWSSIKHEKDFSGIKGVNFRTGKEDWTTYRNNSYVMCVRGN